MVTEKEKLNRGTGTEIWDRLQEIVGGVAGLPQGLLEYDIKESFVHRVIFCGKPGTGKTTALFQFVEKMRRKGIESEVVQYDEILARTVREVGESDSEWGESERELLNGRILDAMMSRKPGVLQVVELAPVGLKDRGQTAIKNLPEDEKESSMLLWLFADLALQYKSGVLRKTLANKNEEIPDEKVEQILAEEHGVDIVGWPSSIAPKQRGRLVKETVSKMALPEDIADINLEVLTKIGIKSDDLPEHVDQGLMYVAEDLPKGIRKQIKDEYGESLRFSIDADVGSMTLYNKLLREGERVTWYADMFCRNLKIE